MRMGDWKARLAPGKALELYNLNNDLSGTQNAADKHPAVVAKIEEYSEKRRARNRPSGHQATAGGEGEGAEVRPGPSGARIR